jgi:RNA 2',3'-cyclic 3'-phosphodiesterase
MAQEQLSLPGIEPAQPPTDRLFFALQPDAATAERISALARGLRGAHGLKGKPLAKPRLHITLSFLGDFIGLPEALLAAAREAATRVRQAPIALHFDRVGSFTGQPRRRPLVLRGDAGLQGVVALHDALTSALHGQGVRLADTRRFTPHLTLLYDARLLAEQRLDPIGWTANEFVLVDSHIGQSRHEVLGRFPLSAPAARPAPAP